jgi:photosystem II stability/assembly factor-like uncharacterized protein
MKKFISNLLFTLLATSLSAQITWHPISAPTQTQLNCISFGTNQVGFIGGNDSVFMKSIDGGKTWNRLALSIAFTTNMRNVIALQFLDAQNGYILVGPYGGLYSTSDGGVTWISEQPNQTNMCFKSSLYFRNAQNGFVGGSMCFQGATIANLTNGIWDTVAVVGGWDASQQIQAFDFRNNLLGLAVGSQSTIFRTTDGGATWDSVYASPDTLNLTDVAFINDTLVYATYATTGLEGALVSFDGGLTWQRDFDLATFAYPSFDAALNVAGRPYFGGRVSWGNGGIIFNQTSTWWNYALVPQRIHALALHSDSTVFAVGDSGYVAVNRLPASIGIAENEVAQVSVYPNPAQNTITLSVPEKAIGEALYIFDMRGACVLKTTISEQNQQIDLAELARGAYILRFEIDKLPPTKLLIE